MNAAARVLNESLIVATRTSQVGRLSLSKQMIALFLLAFAVLISTLAIITITDKNRIEVGLLASLEQSRNNLATSYNQLLLEENTWASPARIEALAQSHLKMSLPDPKKVVLIQEN